MGVTFGDERAFPDDCVRELPSQRKKTNHQEKIFLSNLLFRFVSIVIGDVGDNIAVVDTDDVDDDGSI